MADDKEREIQELRERLAALESQAKPEATSTIPPPPAAPASNDSKNGCVGAVLAIVAIFGLVAYCSSQDSGSGSSLTALSEPETSWMPPEGYSLFSSAGGNNSRIGFKWVKPTNSECRGYDKTCFAMEVVTEKPCYRSFYASVTLLGKDDTNIGWTNDTAQGVDAGEKVRLVFDTYERGVEAARIAEINCY